MEKSLEERLTDMMGACGALEVVEKVLRNDAMFGEACIINMVRANISEGLQAFEECGLDKSVPLDSISMA